MSSTAELRIDSLLDRLAAARAAGRIADSTERNVRLWLTDPAYSRYSSVVAEHIEQGKFRELDDAFWTVLPFGTGGRRGKMYPIGTNVMNERTVGESAQGLADYLRSELGASADLSCVIAHDTRHRSEEFARLSASVLAGNGVRVFLFQGHRSTPQLSFAVRQLQASAGIVISASHNPPSDNGFKCYWSTGAQVLPPHDTGIIRCVESVREIHAADFDDAVRRGLVTLLGPEHDEAYVATVLRESLTTARGIRVVYSPLHGVGMTSVARVLDRAGFRDVHIVQSQATPDGNFPNVPGQTPNPEQPAALGASIELARQVGADLVLASDPDADRLGAAVPDPGTGEWTTLNGNQIAALLADHVISKRTQGTASSPAGSRPATSSSRTAPACGAAPFVLKTLVTTELVTRIAEAHGVTVYGGLPVGFKWLAEAMDRHGAEHFLFGAEESHGYLVGTYARDKDGALAALLLAELAAELKVTGKNLLEHLDALYCRYGYHLERSGSKTRPGREGAAEIERIMQAFRTRPPQRMAGMSVVRVHDYTSGAVRSLSRGHPANRLAGPQLDQLMLEFDRPGWRFVVRPSGTEPKIKLYFFGVVGAAGLEPGSQLAAAKREAGALIERLDADLESYASSVVS